MSLLRLVLGSGLRGTVKSSNVLFKGISRGVPSLMVNGKNVSNVMRELRFVRSLNTTRILKNASVASSSILEQSAKSSIGGKKKILFSSKSVAYWLMGTSGLVFGIVILGGLTRLTESGLSIVEWKPVTGAIPPWTQEEWEAEFEKYKSSPEFQQLNSHIDLDDFKFIFFMEWFHRLWGRAIGAVFILPAIYFAVSKKASPHANKRIFGLTCLLGLQGVIGWWMVYSGLDQQQLDARKSKPTVSQYRLTTHLGAAFLLYMGMIWTGFNILRENKWVRNPKEAMSIFKQLDGSPAGKIRKAAILVLAFTFFTAMSGGMVAGLDAGLIYNSFPKMGEHWVPNSRELMDPSYARTEDKSDLWWRNLLENPTTVQLVHRILGCSAFLAVFGLHMMCSKNKTAIPKNANTMVHAMMGLVTLQVALGISTIIYIVPIPLAAAHQAGALALFTSSILFAAQLRKPRLPVRNVISVLADKAASQPGSKILRETSKLAK
ncbi:hypothetical protein Kpol_526p22 [Vanderwaltozyma polyspora DSM 70294]|uniref:Cytochrome c oxidase assembly protein COX15 n=1 Tax=Vanderwaltozyma polyspora (strain ATCC 22028 / DSM 70294 / BCRC 21397 / CBS 2163 / NBRC 10782 / NRRL Y-8283 / UCD 57-17) TaxID=436907 RepID=A7TLS7_VANPO|nr:uncharacterized protein Kpol_526p22 [Vanderwaltozyma polyspora DSM 70294]EDO16769.1 hypothetical protein Kpol_526p22 [Vanderwaltozyma polyspora DSM 70294]